MNPFLPGADPELQQDFISYVKAVSSTNSGNISHFQTLQWGASLPQWMNQFEEWKNFYTGWCDSHADKIADRILLFEDGVDNILSRESLVELVVNHFHLAGWEIKRCSDAQDHGGCRFVASLVVADVEELM